MNETPDPTMSDPGAAEAIRCADCARSDSLLRDLDPVDRIPISAEALEGFPDGVPRARGMDRRQFLRTGALGFEQFVERGQYLVARRIAHIDVVGFGAITDRRGAVARHAAPVAAARSPRRMRSITPASAVAEWTTCAE